MKFCLSILLLTTASTILAQSARNIQITSDGLIVATQQSGGLLVERGTSSPSEIPLPASVSNFDDISISEDGTALFALSTTSRAVCSFFRAGDTFNLVGCEAPGFNVSPFSGISAKGGVCVISGGTGGFTVMEYSTETAEINPTIRALNQILPNVIGHPDVQLVDASLAAMSTDFADFSSSGLSRFGTMMVDLNTLSEIHNFRVVDTLGFSLVVGPTNFPVVNAFYEDSAGMTYMYTANGGVTVQNPFRTDTTEIIDPYDGFRAVTASVDQENGRLVIGGILDGSQSLVMEYSVSNNPSFPIRLKVTEVAGRLTSIGANRGAIAYVTSDADGIEIVSSSDDSSNLLISNTPSASPVSGEVGSESPTSQSVTTPTPSSEDSSNPLLTDTPSVSPVSSEVGSEPVTLPTSQPVQCLRVCQNGGSCALVQEQICECAQGFEGPFCQFSVSAQSPSSSTLASLSLSCIGLAVTVWCA